MTGQWEAGVPVPPIVARIEREDLPGTNNLAIFFEEFISVHEIGVVKPQTPPPQPKARV